MAHSIKYFLHNHDLSSIPTVHRKTKCGGHNCNPSTRESRDRWIPRALWPASLTYSVISRSLIRLFSAISKYHFLSSFKTSCLLSHMTFNMTSDKVPSQSTGAPVPASTEPVHFGKTLRARHQMAKGTIVHNMTTLGNQNCLLPPQTAQESKCAVVCSSKDPDCHFSF